MAKLFAPAQLLGEYDSLALALARLGVDGRVACNADRASAPLMALLNDFLMAIRPRVENGERVTGLVEQYEGRWRSWTAFPDRASAHQEAVEQEILGPKGSYRGDWKVIQFEPQPPAKALKHG